MTDVMNALADAQATIQARKAGREATALEHRGALAAELIADELTLLRAEVKIVRYLFATYAVRPRKP